MRFALFLLFLLSAAVVADDVAVQGLSSSDGKIWDIALGGFSQQDYRIAVDRVFQDLEKSGVPSFEPGKKSSVGLKVYCGAGAGLPTSKALSRAVIDELLARGFTRDSIVIFDQRRDFLRRAGYLPPLSVGGTQFYGVRVVALEEAACYDSFWFYDSALPPPIKSSGSIQEILSRKSELEMVQKEDRKSLLPVPLLQKFDFWINLPVAMDDPSLGIKGALTNATLSNASNTIRFWRNPASAGVAVAEMGAVPEIRGGWRCSILSLEKYQYIGGPTFNSLYTVSEPRLLAGSNPVAIDYQIYMRINKHRQRGGFPLIEPRPLIFDYCRAIGLGSWRAEDLEYIKE